MFYNCFFIFGFRNMLHVCNFYVLVFFGLNLFMIMLILNLLIKTFGLILPLLIAVAYMTLAERKVMAAMQRRKGPNIVGIFGLLQPLADGLKLFIKETILPSSANLTIFVLAPILTFLLALVS